MSNEAASEGLDLNSEAVPLVEEDVVVVRVTDSTVDATLSVAETLADQTSDPEGGTAEAGVSGEERNLLETFAQGSDICDGSLEEEEEESADVNLIKEDSEREISESVDAGGDRKLGGQPDVALTLKVGASDAPEELKGRVEVTKSETSMAITSLTFEEIHVDLDEKPSFPEKNQGLEVEGVGGSTEANNGFRDVDSSVSLGSLSQDGMQELVTQVTETPADQVIRDQNMDLHLTQANSTPASEAVDESKAATVMDQNQDVDVQIAGAYGSHHEDQRPSPELGFSSLVENQTAKVGGGCSKLDENQIESQFQSIASDSDVVNSVVDLDSCPHTDVNKKTIEEVMNEDERIEVKEIEADVTHPVAGGNQKNVHEVLKEDGGTVEKEMGENVTNPGTDGNKNTVDDTVLDQNQDAADVQIGGACGSHHEDQRMGSPSPELGASSLVKNESMGFGVETAAVGGCSNLNENQTESQFQPIAIDSDVVSSVIHLDSRPLTDVNNKTLEEVMNEDERTEVREIEADATHPGADGNQTSAHEVLKEDGGTVDKAMGENVTNPGTDGNQNTVDAVLDRNQDADVQIAGTRGSHHQDQGMGLPSPELGSSSLVDKQSMGFGIETDAVGRCKLDENQTEFQSQPIACDSDAVSSVVDLDSRPRTDVSKKILEEVMNEDERTEDKEIEADATHSGADGNQKIAHEVLKKDRGTVDKEMGETVTNPGTDGNKNTVDAVLDQNPDVDVQIAGLCRSHHEDQRMGSPSPELGASLLVDSESMGFDVETAAVGGCCKLDENKTEFQSQPIACDSDAVSSVVDLDSRPRTDVNNKTLEEVMNEDERTEVKEIEADATHPGADGNQKIAREVLKEDGGTVDKEMGENVTNPGTDGNKNTVDAVLDQNPDADVQIAGLCGSHHEDQRMGSPFPELGASLLVENESMGFDVETAAAGGCLNLDENQTESQFQSIASDSDVVLSVVDLDSCPHTDVNKKTLEEVMNDDEHTEDKKIEADATHPGADGNQKNAHEVLKEDGGTVDKEMGENVTNPGTDGNQNTVDEVLDRNQDADVQIAGPRGSDHEDQRMGSHSPELAASLLVENESMGFDVETAVAGGCLNLDENQTVSQSQPIVSDSVVVSSLVDLDSRPCTDVNNKTLEEVMNEDEHTEDKEIEADATHPSVDGNQTSAHEVLKEDGGTVDKVMGENVTNPGTDGNHNTVGAVQDENQDADVQIAGAFGSHHEDQRMGSPSPDLGASSIVEKESMGFDVETAAVGGCRKLDENQTESQSQPIASDSDVISSLVDLDSCPGTDVDNKTLEDVMNEGERTEVKEIEADATHPGAYGNQKSAHEVLKEDGGTVDKEMGENVTNPGTDGNQNNVDEVYEEEEVSRVKEMPDDGTCWARDGNQHTADNAFIEDGGTGVKEMTDNVTHLDKDVDKKAADIVDREDERTEVREVGDGVTFLGTDGNLNAVDEVFRKDEGTEVKDGSQMILDDALNEGQGTEAKEAKEIGDDVTHLSSDGDQRNEGREVGDGVTFLGTDGNLKAVDEVFRKDDGTEVKDGSQMILDDSLNEGQGTEAKEIGDDVTYVSSDRDQRNVGEDVKEDEGPGVKEREDDAQYSLTDCLDENLTKNVSRIDSHVSQKIETSEQVTTTLNPGTASVNDNQVFYGLAMEEGDFSFYDLVWGKVKSHPWWPGQIFDPSDASEQAMKYRKKDSFLVAYFGDRTFAWNEASLLKPFRAHFSQMEKQTNLESFRKAVNCALDEIVRRVELGLACSCTSEEVYAKIGSQMIENPGIREESSRREGEDESHSVSSFEPEMLVEYIRALALFPYGGVDRLELVIAQVQLLSFYRSKGYSCLPKFQLCGSLVEDEANSSIMAERKHSKEIVDAAAAISEDEDQALSGKVKLKSHDDSSHKRKHTSEDGVYPSKKERSLSELMAGKKVSSSDDGNESVDGVASRPFSSSSGKKRKGGDSFPDDSVIQNRKRSISLSGPADVDSAQPKRSFKVGESICRVASQLTGSPPILKCSSERLRKGAVKVDQRNENCGDVSPRTPEQRRKIVLPIEHSSPEEMLSQLCLAARDPMKGYSFLTTIISFFSEYRNFVCLDHTSSWKQKMSLEKVGGKKKKSPNCNMDSAESYSFDDMQDSYWTDRIVQIGPEEQPLDQSRKTDRIVQVGPEEQPLDKSRKKRGRPRKKMLMLTNGADNSHQCSPVPQNLDDSAEQPVEIPVGSVDADLKDYKNSPAALILSFSESEADSIPSEKNLNRMFRFFGPLKESETEVLKTTNCARVVFKRRTDAEVALSSAGKFSIFGPMHVSYRLMFWPPTSVKAPSFAATQGTEGISPQCMEDVVPLGIDDMAPQLIEDVAPQLIEDVAPQLIEDLAPQGIEDMEPQGIEDMAPEGIEDIEPEGIEDVEPEGIEDIAPEGIEDVEPHGIEDIVPQHIEDIVPQHIEDMAPQLIEDAAPQGIEDTEPQGIEDMAPLGIEDMAPAGGNTS